MFHVFHDSDWNKSIPNLKCSTNELKQSLEEPLLTAVTVLKRKKVDYSVDILLHLSESWCESKRAISEVLRMKGVNPVSVY